MTGASCRKQARSTPKPLGETIYHVATNFVTTWTSRASNCHPQILRLGAVFICQSLHRDNHGSRQRASPAGVHRSKRTCDRIADENGNAVGIFNSCQNSLRLTDNHIAVDRFAALVLFRFSFFRRLDHAHAGAVDLPAAGEDPLARKKLEKAATILQNVLRCVFVETGKIERIRRHLADAAETRREAVYKAVFFEWSADQGAYAID